MTSFRARAHAPLTTITTITAFLALAACAPSGAADAPAPAPTGAAALSVADPWVKAADGDMTAAFGTLTNASDTEVRIVSAASDAASSVELHETATGADGATVMQEKEGGILLAPGATHELAPGGDHLMLMGLTAPVLPGQDVTVTLTTEDGSTFVLTAPARSFAGANEEYGGGEHTEEHAGTEHP
ncbi:copper chaperone PCu(A)C [Oerskovia turbata]